MENINKSPLMYGIIDSDGAAYIGENCVASNPQELFLELNGLNDSPDAGYKIVALGQVYLVAAAPQVVADERQVLDCAKCEGYGATHYPDGEWEGKCGACHGLGWVSRDADIGTEQECFSCDGSGKSDDAAPVQAQEPTNKEIELAIALGKAQGTLRFIATVSKDKYIAQKALDAATSSPEGAPVQPVAVPDGYAVLQSLHAALSKRCAEQDQYAREGMLKAINTVEREMMKYGKRAAPAAQGDALNVAQIEDGYEGGTCIADPTRLGGTVHLHYISPEHAESAFEIIAEIIDAAIAAKAAKA